MSTTDALIIASSGNIAAIIVNYFIGFWLYEKSKSKLLSSKIGTVSYKHGRKYGYYALLLSWVPVIGDPLTVVAGVVRLKFVWFVIIAGGLRVARYYALAMI